MPRPLFRLSCLAVTSTVALAALTLAACTMTQESPPPSPSDGPQTQDGPTANNDPGSEAAPAGVDHTQPDLAPRMHYARPPRGADEGETRQPTAPVDGRFGAKDPGPAGRDDARADGYGPRDAQTKSKKVEPAPTWAPREAAEEPRAATPPSYEADGNAPTGTTTLGAGDVGSQNGGGSGEARRSEKSADRSASASPSPGVGGALSQAARPVPPPQPDLRPGLGTSWGETRVSPVNEVPFERDGSRPSYSGILHYNDERGARALSGNGYATSASLGLGGAVTVSLRNDYGSILPAYRGDGRTVAVGSNGQRYTIALQNHTNERFEIVLSVDGLDVLDGTDAGYNKRGYLLEPYGTLEVDGFRQSADAVAAFRFGAVTDSYAARTGSARNVGVIGAVAFGERGYQARLRAYQDRVYAMRQNGIEIDRRRVADPFPSGYALPPMQVAR